MVFNHCKLTEKAYEDLVSNLNYIPNNLGNPAAAKRFFDHVFNSLDKLCLFPMSYPTVDSEFIKRKDLRKLIIDNFLAYKTYDAANSTVSVLRIVYGRRDILEVLRHI